MVLPVIEHDRERIIQIDDAVGKSAYPGRRNLDEVVIHTAAETYLWFVMHIHEYCEDAKLAGLIPVVRLAEIHRSGRMRVQLDARVGILGQRIVRDRSRPVVFASG